MHYVTQRPGSALVDLRDQSGLGWGTFYLVMSELEEAGLVQRKRQGRAVFVYPAGAKVPQDPQADRLTSAAKRVALLIIQEPGMDVPELMEASGLSARMAYHHVKRLVQAGYVESDEEGHYRGLRPTAKLFHTLGLV